MRISDWSSDVGSSDLQGADSHPVAVDGDEVARLRRIRDAGRNPGAHGAGIELLVLGFQRHRDRAVGEPVAVGGNGFTDRGCGHWSRLIFGELVGAASAAPTTLPRVPRSEERLVRKGSGATGKIREGPN